MNFANLATLPNFANLAIFAKTQFQQNCISSSEQMFANFAMFAMFAIFAMFAMFAIFAMFAMFVFSW